jgi:acetyl esterase/lipase
MKKIIIPLSTLLLFFFAVNLIAQTKAIKTKVWHDKIPGSIENSNVKEDTLRLENGGLRIRNVIDPTLTVFFPPKEKAIGAAVIICPGGGYARLAIDHEGIDVAKWLNSFGVTGIVLKYRLPNDAIMKNKSVGPLQDVQEAIRIARRNATEWGLNPNKIGVMGFSAGGHLASTASTLFNDKLYETDLTSARPDFSILIYPVISLTNLITHAGSHNNLIGEKASEELINHFSSDQQVTANTPPVFLVHAADDKTVPVQNSIDYFLAMKKLNLSAEMHIYEKGGHGFGLALNRGTESTWPEMCKAWLKQIGIL